MPASHARRHLNRLSAALAAWVLASSPALADAIDGDWCHASATLSISGERIRTPTGRELTGSYGRHDFSYVVPAGDPGAGGRIEMRLLNEETMELYRQAGAASETWRRCKPIS